VKVQLRQMCPLSLLYIVNSCSYCLSCFNVEFCKFLWFIVVTLGLKAARLSMSGRSVLRASLVFRVRGMVRVLCYG